MLSPKLLHRLPDDGLPADRIIRELGWVYKQAYLLCRRQLPVLSFGSDLVAWPSGEGRGLQILYPEVTRSVVDVMSTFDGRPM